MASPFFSGRIPQELYDRVDQHIKESGEGKTQILINALSQYLGFETPKQKSSGVNADFLSELESLKERVSLLERSQSQQAIEPIKITEIPHKQMSLLDHASDNSDNSIDNTITVESTNNIIDNSNVINEQTLTTKEVEELTGITRRQLDRIKAKGVYPINAENYVIVRYAGKQSGSHGSNLWVVITTDNN